MISPWRGVAQVQRAIVAHPGTPAFIGRRAELAKLRALLAAHRLVTVVGPSGIGKSRLLREFVRARRDGDAQMVVCDLRDAGDADGMLVAILLSAGADRVAPDEALRTLERVLPARGPMLLVLDGVDALLPGAAVVVQRLLQAAPELRIACAGRTPLGLDDVAPETVLDLEGLDDERAADLALERARVFGAVDVPRAFALDVGRRLGGIPLAIELAAAQLGRDDVLSRLSGLPERFDDERSVRRAVDRAWSLLGDEEREVLADLTVFHGGIAFERVVEVCELGPRAEVIALRLARRGLLEVASDDGSSKLRLAMADSVRAHAEAALESGGREQAVSLRHLRSFDAVPGGAIERDNQRAAIAFASSLGMQDVALRLLIALDAASPGMGASRADLSALDGALLAGATQDPRLLARAFVVRATALHSLGRLAEEKRDAQTALALARGTGDEALIASATSTLGRACFQLGELSDARACFERAIELHRARGDRAAVASVLQPLAAVLASQGELELSRIHHENALALAVEGEDAAAEARATIGLGSLWLEIGDVRRARAHYQRGLAQARRLRMTRTDRIVTGYLGILAFQEAFPSAVRGGEAALHEAEAKLRTAATQSGDAGDLRVEGFFEGVRGAVLASLDRVEEARACFERAEAALARNPFFAEVIAIHRGHLDLALARRAEANGERDLAEGHRVHAGIRLMDAYDPSTRRNGNGEPPITVRSDDARIAGRILERALDAAEGRGE